MIEIRRALALLLTTPLLAVTACTSHTSIADPPAQVVPSTPSPSSAGPAKPETAEHFIRRFYEAEKEMENTGQTADYRALTRDCESATGCADKSSGSMRTAVSSVGAEPPSFPSG